MVTNKTRCEFERIIHDLAFLEYEDLLNVDNDESGKTEDVIAKFPALHLESLHKLNAPLQLFNIIDMFSAKKAKFPNIFKENCVNFLIGVKDVDQETIVRLGEKEFDIVSKISETQNVWSLCGETVIFFIHSTKKKEENPIRIEAFGVLEKLKC